MNAKEAAIVLGVSLDTLDHNSLSLAFSRAVKLAHPDTGGGREGSIEAIDKAKKARDTLREYIDKGGTAPKLLCGACGGLGRVAGRFGNVTCPRCGGAGHR